MKHRSISVALVALVCAGGLALRAEDLAAPARSAAKHVTGTSTHLRRVVDAYASGTGPFVEIIPIDPSALGLASYPEGVVVAGDTVTLGQAPQRLWFELHLGGWGSGDDLCTWQMTVDRDSFSSGLGADLKVPDRLACEANDDCSSAFGVSSSCYHGSCGYLFQDRSRDDFAVNGISAAHQEYLRVGSTVLPNSPCAADDGLLYYGANLVLDAPDGAAGVYDVRLRNDRGTFMVLETGEIVITEFRPARVVVNAPVSCCHGDGTCTIGSGVDCQDAGGTIAPGCSGDCNVNGVDDACEALPDCNDNAIPDDCELNDGSVQDCNENGIPDECDIAEGVEDDCDSNGIPDECEPPGSDCNRNGIDDACELGGADCNRNGRLDECDLAFGADLDCDADGVLDECELAWEDCNRNGIVDVCEGLPDCEPGAFVEIVPIDPTTVGAPPYPPGVNVIGDTVTTSHAAQPLWFEIRLGGWIASGGLCQWEITVDQDSFGNGLGVDLHLPAPTACELDDHCSTIFGFGSECDPLLQSCLPFFQDSVREDLAIDGLSFAISRTLRAGSSASQGAPCEIDDRSTFYGANLVLNVPEGAAGAYEIRLLETTGTYLQAVTAGIPITEFRPARVEVNVPVSCCHVDDRCWTQTVPDCLDAEGTVVHDCLGDCNNNGLDDACEALPDCNQNDLPDECDAITGGDFDADGIVGFDDLKALIDCLSGPGTAPEGVSPQCVPACLAAFDDDDDGDLDLANIAIFQQLFTGP